MHFHLPKPLHGWREFFGEVGIIVVGVLIALGAEQIVEVLHWHEKAGHARESLGGEVANNYRSAAERIIETPCLNAQLDRMKDAVLRAGPRLAPMPVYSSPMGPTVFRHSSRPWGDSIWQSIVAEQVSSHLRDEERLDLASLYNSVAFARRLDEQETSADGVFLTLSSPLPLDPSLRAHLLEAIEAERIRVNMMNLIAQQQMVKARHLFPQIAESLRDRDWFERTREPSSTVEWCRSNGLPLAAPPQ